MTKVQRFSMEGVSLLAVLLLLLGGLANAKATSTAASGTWKLTGSLNQARTSLTVTLLNNGNVLATGGVDNYNKNALASAELYDTSTGKWTLTGSMQNARVRYTAVLLNNGQVLAAAGENNVGNILASSELYNPTTGLWTLTQRLHDARLDHQATLLSNGQVLVVGGDGINGYLATAELFTLS